MQETPSISVLMCVYNGEAYLADAIESILNQTHTDFEFIVVNDASTDDTEMIIGSFDDDRIRAVTQPQPNLSAARNRGVEMAQAPLIACMDADDWSYPDRLETQRRFMDLHPEVVVVGSSYECIDERNAIVRIFDPVLEDIHMRRELFLRNPLGHASVLMRTDAVRAVGGYEMGTAPARDYELWTRMARVGDLANIPEILYRYRLNPVGISATRAEEQRRASLKIIESLWDGFPFPDLSVRLIVEQGRRYRRTCREGIYSRYVYDQYALFFALLLHGRSLGAMRPLFAALRMEPMRIDLIREAFRHRRSYVGVKRS